MNVLFLTNNFGELICLVVEQLITKNKTCVLELSHTPDCNGSFILLMLLGFPFQFSPSGRCE